MMRFQTSIPVVGALVTVAASCAPPASTASAPQSPLTLSVRDVSGQQRPLAELAHGRVAVVHMWATWCDACLRELPAVARLRAALPSERAVLVDVAVGEAPATVQAFAARARLPEPQLVDEDFAFADAVNARRVPTILVVDVNGHVVHVGHGLDASVLDALRTQRVL
jgi:thiol-disulfide isomerase/thioredoxin